MIGYGNTQWTERVLQKKHRCQNGAVHFHESSEWTERVLQRAKKRYENGNVRSVQKHALDFKGSPKGKHQCHDVMTQLFRNMLQDLVGPRWCKINFSSIHKIRGSTPFTNSARPNCAAGDSPPNCVLKAQDVQDPT